MHMQENLWNDYNHKWSTYLQQFQLNIKHEKDRTNHIVDYISRRIVTTVLNSYGHETSRWPKLYDNGNQHRIVSSDVRENFSCNLYDDSFLQSQRVHLPKTA